MQLAFLVFIQRNLSEAGEEFHCNRRVSGKKIIYVSSVLIFCCFSVSLLSLSIFGPSEEKVMAISQALITRCQPEQLAHTHARVCVRLCVRMVHTWMLTSQRKQKIGDSAHLGPAPRLKLKNSRQM